jgi:drug/metabolite transporter (DMT)-like permease
MSSDPTSERRDEPLRGVAYMLAASASFATMSALASSLGRAGIPWQLSIFVRAASGLVLAYAVARVRGAALGVASQRVMWTRSLAGTGAMVCTFFALEHIPLSDAVALLNTTPLWVAVLAWLTLGERVGRFVLVALCVAVIGIALIERPSVAVGNLAGVVALGAGASSALAMVSLRRLWRETPESVVVHFSAVSTGVAAALLAMHFHEHGAPPLHVTHVVQLLGMGVAATVGQLFMTRAYASDRAARVGAVGWLQIVFGVGIDVAVLRHVPAAATVAGIVLVVSAGVLLVWDARRENVRSRGVSV